ncbi:metal-sulfur cluster assembly factor [Dietzia aurantiaca]|uniref:Metal-sulfur cluster assembly factor n=1 Tax=Dietzia aurantiaca TaxID=983873 RepID=A0ABV9PRL4_9ACTN|nr:metal-sulfur cluster assembly factor [Dietzia aurantiaca]MCD2261841.1 metal-sulfur cluster assembly factor [Dietzia aurantiaca]
MTEQMTPANDPSVDDPMSGAENDTDPGTAYNGEFRPDPNRPEQSEDDLALVADLEEAMRDVVDPELGINVVDLGLVYDIWVRPGETEGSTIARVDMTLTSAACPLTDVIEDQARSATVGSDLVNELELNWVWMPPWGPQMITDDGREQLRAIGFTV